MIYMTEEELKAHDAAIREACAKIAETYDKHPVGYRYVSDQIGRAIATSIRALGKTT